jgi:hypothetical protein
LAPDARRVALRPAPGSGRKNRLRPGSSAHEFSFVSAPPPPVGSISPRSAGIAG